MSMPTRVALVVLLAILAATFAAAEIFYDDFSRADGPPAGPWFPLNGELEIASERLVENPGEYGMTGCLTAREFTDGSLQVLFSFNGDEDDGRFNLFLGGGAGPDDSWGFNAVISHDGLALRTGPPDQEIASSDYVPPPDAVLRARLTYLVDIEEVSLVIETPDGDVVASCAAAAATAPFGWFAVSIENTLASSKWLDDVYLTTNGRMSDTLADGIELSGFGFMDGSDGLFMEVLEDGAFVEATFYVFDDPYLRMHAYTQEFGGPFTLYPSDRYLVKLDAPTVGDTWPSFMSGLVTAEITAVESITTPMGAFDALRIEYREEETEALVFVVWLVDGIGFVRYGPGDYLYWDVVAYGIVGGEGILPIALGNWWATDVVVGVAGELPLVAQVTCYPNPFNPRTVITGTLPVAGHARLRIFDLRGRQVTTLLDEAHAGGPVEVLWDGRDRGGRDVPGGVYLARLEVAGQVATGRLTLVR